MAIERCIVNLVKKYKYFERFEDGWPIRDMITTKLQNVKYSIDVAHKAEMGEDHDNSDSITAVEDVDDTTSRDDSEDEEMHTGGGSVGGRSEEQGPPKVDSFLAASAVRANRETKVEKAHKKGGFTDALYDAARLERLCLASRERIEAVLNAKERSFIWKCLEEEVRPVTCLASRDYPVVLGTEVLDSVNVITAADYFGEDGKNVLASTLADMFPADDMDPYLIAPFRARSFVTLFLMPELVIGILCIMHGISQEQAFDLKISGMGMRETRHKVKEELSSNQKSSTKTSDETARRLLVGGKRTQENDDGGSESVVRFEACSFMSNDLAGIRALCDYINDRTSGFLTLKVEE
ncbi:hypothetical protein GLOTRDRAFT_133151 [Gloeophyllum trabeum ATCC 11539]|uniref:Uncharacterized protein n=1 Tax=Gloeophyllum trabeum (strain ATCC 11539 / FP-39264 / Madison 617) TaxID=670483 RepID=S7RAJ2_GLOTA|nr:uncharacterized protein GLOTRDRAFT_133151 [Gloeophyllum trabeum ATCC 11539]EPQ51275.1 hypothetical protein GLOTRDRAFT_133151 [Gloeophyllum trabeum ATCC 11539]